MRPILVIAPQTSTNVIRLGWFLEPHFRMRSTSGRLAVETRRTQTTSDRFFKLDKLNRSLASPHRRVHRISAADALTLLAKVLARGQTQKACVLPRLARIQLAILETRKRSNALHHKPVPRLVLVKLLLVTPHRGETGTRASVLRNQHARIRVPEPPSP